MVKGNRKLSPEEKIAKRKELLQKIAMRCYREIKVASKEKDFVKLERILNCLYLTDKVRFRYPEKE